MGGQEQLAIVAMVIGTIVIVTMSACFAILFWIYARQRRKNIASGGEDEDIRNELDRMLDTWIRRSNNRDRALRKRLLKGLSRNNDSQMNLITREDFEILDGGLYLETMKRKEKGDKGLRVLTDFLYGLFISLSLIIAAFGIVMASINRPVFIGNTSYIVIQTGSMEEKDPDNEYLESLDDQIRQYSLIGIDRVDFIYEVELYDIIAFYDFDDNIIVHRVVDVHEEDGERVLQTRGDSNDGSYSYEMAIGQDRLIGVYDGFQSYGLGIMVTYIRSTIGIIALFGFGGFLLAYFVTSTSIEKAYESRKEMVAIMLDSGIH